MTPHRFLWTALLLVYGLFFYWHTPREAPLTPVDLNAMLAEQNLTVDLSRNLRRRTCNGPDRRGGKCDLWQ